MGAAKQIFEKSPELRKWWISIVEDDRFKQVLMFTRSELLDGNPAPGERELQGALAYERNLVGLVEVPEPGTDLLTSVNPGLSHVEPQREVWKGPEKKDTQRRD